MNKLLYLLYRLHARIGSLISKKISEEDVVKYKLQHDKPLSLAEQFRILQDVEKVCKGELKLSEYIEKRGTAYVDEKFWPLLQTKKDITDKSEDIFGEDLIFGHKIFDKYKKHEY